MPPEKYARLERERRFLLAQFPNNVTVVRDRRISDNYIEGTTLRLREQSDSDGLTTFKLTQKLPMRGTGAQQGFITAGPNGAGKTTFAHEFLPKYADCKNFVIADLIAQAIAPFSPQTAAFRAGRMMLDEMHTFANRRMSFAFETTLSGKGYLSFLRRLKARRLSGSHLLSFACEPGACTLQGRERVLHGGHDVPEAVVRRRFDRSMRNFWSTIACSRVTGYCSTIQAGVLRPSRWRRGNRFV